MVELSASTFDTTSVRGAAGKVTEQLSNTTGEILEKAKY